MRKFWNAIRAAFNRKICPEIDCESRTTETQFSRHGSVSTFWKTVYFWCCIKQRGNKRPNETRQKQQKLICHQVFTTTNFLSWWVPIWNFFKNRISGKTTCSTKCRVSDKKKKKNKYNKNNMKMPYVWTNSEKFVKKKFLIVSDQWERCEFFLMVCFDLMRFAQRKSFTLMALETGKQTKRDILRSLRSLTNGS